MQESINSQTRNNQLEEILIMEIISILIKSKFQILIVTLLMTFLSILYVSQMPKAYKASLDLKTIPIFELAEYSHLSNYNVTSFKHGSTDNSTISVDDLGNKFVVNENIYIVRS